ncbi:acetyltransferas-like protein [Hyaloscypha hepaticicola]|uniref:Acetyltransferas-like protein n=1 Tax=Hyaloscypha hepaticicola TaxID=2082293 RepID=A0A2J6PLH9_9HELO|nr:acetyltransferas-like protein [Hyaloscypha hepaticicola]
MTFTLRPATVEDVDQLTEIYFSAFQNDAVSLLAFPRNDASREWWRVHTLSDFKDPNARLLCIIDPSSPTPSKIISWCKWVSPAAIVDTSLPTWPEGSDVEIANRFFENLLTGHERIMKGRKHWYLEFLATRPEEQGKGAAGMLLRWGIQKADEEGTEAYLEASPDGKPIYEHYGFEETERLVVSLEGKEGVNQEKEFIECFMVRPVAGKK